jgi:hypothetical protein
MLHVINGFIVFNSNSLIKSLAQYEMKMEFGEPERNMNRMNSGNADTVRFIKSRRMTWLGHVMRKDGWRMPRRILEWKPVGRRIRGDQGKDGLKTSRMISRRWE